ncbi:MAG TPA: glycosyltransferase family 1 protein [Crinalium sp.]
MTDSELNNLIAPEIKDDEFYQAIQRLARRKDIKTVLEIGSSSGGGSTEAFVKGLRDNPSNPSLFCMEVSKPRFTELQNRYASEGFVKCYNVSSVPVEKFPSREQIADFYALYDTPLKNYSAEQVLGWLQQDIDYVKTAGVPGDGIQRIKAENNIDCFDMVLIDGSEFTGNVELDEVYGAKFILLDDICTYKNYDSHQRLLEDLHYILIAQNKALRNGYSIFRKLDDWELQQTQNDLPIHFFTIVLNGEPFIRYHIDVLKQLPFRWHWHIVEGVAELKHDTAWSLHSGGHIADDLHDRGRSNDGTLAYLDELQQNYPDNVTVYRKPEGTFWDGKREMVNAPLENILEKCLLWQIDVDELWTADQLCQARELFINNPDKTAAYYWCWYFVGERLVISSRNCYTQNPKQEWLRTWRFEPGSIWAAHEPPRLVKPLENGQWQDVATINPFLHQDTEKAGLLFQHFAYVTPQQLQFKESYYGYQGAIAQWMQLQEPTEFPIFLREHFSWVQDDTLVEPIDSCGVTPIMEKEPGTEIWRFLQLNELEQRAMKTKKAFPQIVIDGVFFQFTNSGIAQVWKSLLEEWVKVGFAEHVVVLDRGGTAPRIPGVRYRPVKRFDYDQTGNDSAMLQEICDEKGADLFISTYYTIPTSTPSIFMAYDMIPEVIQADLTAAGWREKHYGIFHASQYITISESTSRDLVKFFPHISPEAVTVAHCGVKSVFSPAASEEIEQFKQKFNISKPYYLLVGERVGLNGYKNGIFFFRALARLSREEKQAIAVVCVGGRNQLEPELATLAQGVETHVLALDDAELRVAYSGAIALVYPSLYEGFGLPIAEAMACACPVITCQNSSIPEVAGEAALYVKESRLNELVEALRKVQDSQLRQSMISAGLAQSQKFSWSKMAEIVADVLIRTAKQLKSDEDIPVSPVWSEFRKLQLQLQQIQAAPPVQPQVVQSAASPTVQFQPSPTSAARSRQVDFDTYSQLRQRFLTVKTKLEQTQARLSDAEGLIMAMKTSKFWKIRSTWFRLKKVFGLPIDDA